VIAAAGIAIAVAAGASAQQAPAPGTRSAPRQAAKLASADRDFVLTAAKGGMAEVALGELAGMNAKNDAVKRFGQRMVADHGKANQALADLAQEKGVELPKDVDRAHKGVQDRLAKLQGDAFDRAYVEEMVKDHRKDVKEFERASTSAKDPAVKAWAGKTLPTLREHLREVENLSAKVLTKK
jgi:putative membrane protein